MIDKYYIVYNVNNFKEPNPTVIYPKELLELYSLLLNSPYIVSIEQHVSDDFLTSEWRVIWWSEESYNQWANENRKRYTEITNKFKEFHIKENIDYQRLTSKDHNYVSPFPYTDYPDKNDLIDWTLVSYHKDHFVKNILPLGSLKEYKGENVFVDAKPGKAARFIKERTSDIVRRPISNVAKKSFPLLLAYSFEQAVLTSMYTAPWLYRKLTQLTYDCEAIANNYIKDCDNAAVLVGHQQLGYELPVHAHRVSNELRYTFTIAVRLTFNDKGIRCKFYEPFSKDDDNLPYYYSHHNLLNEYVKNKKYEELIIQARTSILVFNAAFTPHSAQYDNDIYIFYVYDNVTFKENALEKIKEHSQTNFFRETAGSELYFFDYQYTALE